MADASVRHERCYMLERCLCRAHGHIDLADGRNDVLHVVVGEVGIHNHAAQRPMMSMVLGQHSAP